MSADRNLLFGLLALQLDFISREQLLAGMRVWTGDQSRSLSEILAAAGSLQPANLQVLEVLVERHIAAHQGKPEHSLAALRLASSQSLEDIYVTLSANLTTEIPQSISLSHQVGSQIKRSSISGGPRYVVLSPYREGGLGTVSIALDSELDREVALKEMKPKLADDTRGRLRFVREAEITGGLEHPNIVPVYGLGKHADGRPYYAMRLIRGDTSLADEIKSFHAPSKDPFAAEQNLRLRGLLQRFIAVCEAIEYAHARGVIHRDLKPANIMLGKFGETLVVDWGLAKILQASGDAAAEPRLRIRAHDSADVTAMGSALGTPAFMAPEQAEGRLDLLGPATDVYGLGATLYSLLTGQVPVTGKSVDEVLERVRQGDVVPPRTRVRTLPAPLAAICLKALARQPQDRYASAKDLAADLTKYLADEPVTAYRDPPLVRARRWARKRPALTSGALAAIVVTLIGLLIGFVVLQQKNRELGDTLSSMVDLADAYSSRGGTSDVLPYYVRAVELLKANVGPEDRRTLVAMSNLAVAYRESGRNAEALPLGEAVFQVRKARLGMEHPETLTSMNGLVESYLDAGRFAEAVALCEEVWRKRIARLGRTHEDTLESMLNLALALKLAGRLNEALPLYEEGVELMQSTLGPTHRNTLTSKMNLAIAYSQSGRLDEAVPYFEAVLQGQRANFNPTHIEFRRALSNLAYAYQRQGRFLDAIPRYEELLPLQKDQLGSDHDDTRVTKSRLRECYQLAQETANDPADAANWQAKLNQLQQP